MIRPRYLWFLFLNLSFSLITWKVSAQFHLPGNLTLNTDAHEFGNIKQGSIVGFDFILTNHSAIDVYLQRSVVPEDFSYIYGADKIAPGESTNIRIEVHRVKPGHFHELVNIYSSAGKDVFAVHLTGNIIPLKTDSNMAEEPDTMARIKEKPGELLVSLYKPNNIVFLLDVSESMMRSDRLPLVKLAMKNLLNSLRSIDRVSIITYASGVNVLLPSTPADQKEAIAGKIDALRARGNTEGGKGIRAAYKVAHSNFISGGNNEIVIATDGDFDLDKSNDILYKYIRHNAEEGIIISVVGVGNIARAIAQMQAIAENGSGSYIHIATKEDAEEVLLDEIRKQSKK